MKNSQGEELNKLNLIPLWKVSQHMDQSIADSWEIEVKVINKSQIKEYRGGRLFKVDL